MKSIAFILFIALIILLAVTNPSMEDFRSFIEEHIEQDNSSGTGLEEVLRDVFAGPIADLAAQVTTRDNYYLVSVFTIPIEGADNKYLGIAGHFIPLAEPWKEQFRQD